jgi:hypothetical protein
MGNNRPTSFARREKTVKEYFREEFVPDQVVKTGKNIRSQRLLESVLQKFSE